MCPVNAQDAGQVSIKSTGVAQVPPSLSTPGILTVCLHEAINLSAKDDFKEQYNDYKHYHDSSRTHPISCRGCNLPYALLTYERSESSVPSYRGDTYNPVWGDTQNPVWGDTQNLVWGGRHHGSRQFDVSSVGELTIYLYLGNPDSTVLRQDLCLGVVRVSLLDAMKPAESQWLGVEEGTGSLCISFEYKASDNVRLKTSHFVDLGSYSEESASGYLCQRKKNDTQRLYVQKAISVAEGSLQLEAAVRARASRISHPFIATPAFTIPSVGDSNPPELYLNVLSPFVSGGHLFHHVQMERRLDVGSCRFYAAEIVCALEYLHDSQDIFGWLKPKNVCLDAVGHVVFCASRIFMPDADGSVSASTEYPAPELLLPDHTESKMADWWTLGVFVYEMLTGLPPFYDDDPEIIRENILNQQVRFPESMASSAQDLATRLLERSPEKRLGALAGAREIKAHPFFDGIDWHNIFLRKCTPPFKHYLSRFDPFQPFDELNIRRPLKQHGVKTSLAPRKYASTWGGIAINFDFSESFPKSRPVPLEYGNRNAVQIDGGWDLIWEGRPRKQFQFFNRVTGVKSPVPPRAIDLPTSSDNAIRTQQELDIPSSSQKLDALEAALAAGYFSAVKQLLDYNVDLNVQLFGKSRKSPLRWAIGEGNADLVRLFLDHGADVNMPGDILGYPVLVAAVKVGNQDIVEALVMQTGRIASTRALCHAVDRRDIATIKLLLENGVRCNFEDGDRPHPPHPGDGCYFTDISEPDEFMPPLNRAVEQKDVELVNLLLSHGADPNATHHDTFECFRAFELAIKLGEMEIVHLLLDHGADVDRPPEVWALPSHVCSPFPRPEYQKITAGLRAAAAKRNISSA